MPFFGQDILYIEIHYMKLDEKIREHQVKEQQKFYEEKGDIALV